MAFPKIQLDEEFRRGAAALAALSDEEGWVPAIGDMLASAGPEMMKSGKETLSGAGRGAKELIKRNTQLDELYQSLFQGTGKKSGLQLRKKRAAIPSQPQEEIPYGPENPPPNEIDLAAILRAASGDESPMFRMGAFDVGKNSKGTFSKTKTNGRDWTAINDEMQRIRMNSRPTINDNSIDPKDREALVADMVKAQHYSQGQGERGNGGDREQVATIRGISELFNNESLTPERLQMGLSILNAASGGRFRLDEITNGLFDAKTKSPQTKGDSGGGYGGLGAGLGTVAGLAAAPYLGVPTLLAGLLGLGLGAGTGTYLSPDE